MTTAAGDRPAGPGWPHADTAMALTFAAAGGTTWLIVGPDGTVIGECGTKAPPDPDGVVEIGYGLAGPSRGRGLGTQAVAALLGLLGADGRVRVVRALVQPTNLASRRLLERLGFTEVDAGHDEIVYERSTPR